MRGLALALQAPPDYFTSRCTDPVAQMVLFRWGWGAVWGCRQLCLCMMGGR